jgi:hypothetical protein
VSRPRSRSTDWRSPRILATRSLIDKDWETYTETIAHLSYGWSEGEQARRYAALIRDSLRPAVIRAVVVPAMNAWEVTSLLPQVRSPTLVLHRTGDKLEPVGQGRYIAEHVPGAIMLELPGEDHGFPMDDLVPHLGRFLESVRAEQAEFDRILATVLFTDIVDSTAQAAAIGDVPWKEMRSRHDQIVRAQIGRYRGREIKTMGDGFLATFDGPARGVRCAQQIVQAVQPLGVEVRASCIPAQCRLRVKTSRGSGSRSALASARSQGPLRCSCLRPSRI